MKETNETASLSVENISTAMKKQLCSMSVAEFREKINPMPKQYDACDYIQFLMDDSIELKTKIEILFGKMIANLIDYSNVDNIYATLKGKMEENAKKAEI